MPGVIPETDPRSGWFKLLIPEIQDVFDGIFWSEELKISLMPFIYGKVDPEQVAFDTQLSIPFIPVDKVVFVEKGEKAVEEDSGPKILGQSDAPISIPVIFKPLNLISADSLNRCYIPAECVVCILPVDPVHPFVTNLVAVTTESGLIVPITDGKVLDLTTGRLVDIREVKEPQK